VGLSVAVTSGVGYAIDFKNVGFSDGFDAT
jgi:hypothetical protein